jgi:hypothetical protein
MRQTCEIHLRMYAFGRFSCISRKAGKEKWTKLIEQVNFISEWKWVNYPKIFLLQTNENEGIADPPLITTVIFLLPKPVIYWQQDGSRIFTPREWKWVNYSCVLFLLQINGHEWFPPLNIFTPKTCHAFTPGWMMAVYSASMKMSTLLWNLIAVNHFSIMYLLHMIENQWITPPNTFFTTS